MGGLAWQTNLQASPAVLQRRLETSPTTNLVCVMNDVVVAVLYMQRILSLDVISQQRFQQVSETHSADGPIIQLIAIAADPKLKNMGIGSELRAFALHLARVDANTESVVAVTLCRNYKNYNKGTLQNYVDKHVSGIHIDPIINFHTSFGAQVVRLVPDFRPEDTDNSGTGVLIQYSVKDLPKLARKPSISAVPSKHKVKTSSSVRKVEQDRSVFDILANIMAGFGYDVNQSNSMNGFFEFGMDSLELVEVQNKLSDQLGLELPATLLFDFPTVDVLARHLDIECRCLL